MILGWGTADRIFRERRYRAYQCLVGFTCDKCKLNYLQSLIVACFGIHLDFQGIYLKRVRAFARIVRLILPLASFMEISDLLH